MTIHRRCTRLIRVQCEGELSKDSNAGFGILEVLERHHQRATFGAVAGILGRETQSLFNGYVRSSKTAWVVNKKTGLPTGAKESNYPPGLLQNERVIDSTEDLQVWLQEHH